MSIIHFAVIEGIVVDVTNRVQLSRINIEGSD